MRQLFEMRVYNIRLVNLIATGVLATLALGLYMAKMRAAEARDTITTLRAQLLEDRRAITVLRAEIAHLEQPDRLKYLAQTYLGLAPREARQEPGEAGLAASVLKDAPKAPAAKSVAAPAAAPDAAPAAVAQMTGPRTAH